MDALNTLANTAAIIVFPFGLIYVAGRLIVKEQKQTKGRE